MVAAIALGSNLPSRWGDRQATILEAIRRMEGAGRVGAVSRFHDTEPVGIVDQPRFLNGAMLLETTLGATELMGRMLGIEASMGRRREIPKGPRVIDLDLLLYGDHVIACEGLTVPHPELARRRFVLAPLSEIAPAMRHPVTGQSVLEMLAALDG